MRRLAAALTLLVAWYVSAAPRVELARSGRARQPVVVASQASERVRQAAEDLAAMLGRITGAEFSVETGDGSHGIAVGLADDFPELKLQGALAVHTIADREKCLLRSHARGLLVLGATELGVEDAVWGLLHRLGFRQFFPGRVWEVVPHLPDMSLAIDVLDQPDYLARRIWYGFGLWDYNAEPYAQWCLRNRAGTGFKLQTGHAYGGLIRAHREAFAAHPEFYGLLDGERKSTKLCIGNPALRELVVEHALQYFAQHADADCISMEPSDGGGWCQCSACARLGSITDRALTLANRVAAAVSRKYPDKYVGMYAYSSHSPPPNITAHPHVIISIATAFIRGGYTLDELIEGWSAKANLLGIREYYSVNTWDRDMPGRSRGSRLDYLAETVPRFHACGARFLSAESSDNWGPNGLGYYLAARMLWDVDEAGQVEERVDDFLTRAFGPAKGPMAEFYRLLDGSHEWLVFDDAMGRMFRSLAEARRQTDSALIDARLQQLALYARYVELFHDYSRARGEKRQAAFEALIRHAYRMRRTMMVHTKALYRDLPARDKTVHVPPECRWNTPKEKNPWKSGGPFTEDEVAKILRAGSARHPPVELGFKPIEFSLDLAPARSLHLREVSLGKLPPGRGEQVFYTWVDDAPATIELHITGGLIAHYRDRGNVRIQVHHVEGAGQESLVASDRSVPPDGKPHTVRLTTPKRGLHRIVINDGHDMTRVDWNPGALMTILSSRDQPANLRSRWTLYFYVPRGTTVLGLYARGGGEVRDADGQVRLSVDGQEGRYHAIPVPAGQDGRLWQVRNWAGQVRLMTVPPCLARSADELLLPSEVVRAAG